MTKFTDLKLDPKVLQAVVDAGYEHPTPIQAGAIPPALEGRDVLGIAQTGTGKTASFTLPMITLLGRGRARARMPRSLVLCPTRELAAQVAENFDTYAKNTRLTKALLIGGVSFGEQDKLIDRGVDVLIATPGRLLDHFERGKLLLTGVQIMVVDEADRMLDMGFIPDIERIFQLTPFTRQTLFFSATMAPEIERITNTFLHAPERIEIARQATASETITQRLIEIAPARRDQTAKHKRDLLRALIDAEGEKLTNAIVFCNRKTDVDIVAKSLKKHGYDAAPLHGDLDQSHRTKTLEGFRDGNLKLLIASDVAARGLDIPAVSHVFNFDLPSHAEDYVHRIGRTGRAGRLGTAISIASPADEKYLSAIENLVKQTLPRSKEPEGFAVSANARPSSRSDRPDRNERRGSSRDRRRGSRNDDEQPKTTAQPEPQQTRSEEPVKKEATAPSPRREEQPRPEKREQNRDDRRRGRGRHDDHRGPAVMGMGDHVPQFMLVELRPASLTSGSDASDDGEDKGTVVTTTEAPAPAQAEKPARRSRSRRRAKPAEDVTATESTENKAEAPATSEAEAASAPPPAETGAAETTTVEAPATEAPVAQAPVKPKRTRRRKSETAAAATTETATAEPVTEAAAETSTETATAEAAPVEEKAKPAPKPRKPRARKPKSEPAAETVAPAATEEAASPVAEPAAEEKPKPKRTRRKKADEPAAEAEAETAAEPKPAPKRTRRKKAEPAAEEPTKAQGEGADQADA